jgi:hypothetical protein
MAEGTVRRRFDDSLGVAEMGIYSVLAVLLSLNDPRCPRQCMQAAPR